VGAVIDPSSTTAPQLLAATLAWEVENTAGAIGAIARARAFGELRPVRMS
jgi:hypothetical protein